MPDRARRDAGITWGLAVAPFPTGVIMAVLDERFTAASWRFAGGMPGGYSFWAGILLVSAVLMVAALIRRNPDHHGRNELWFIGMFLTGLWWLMLATLFLITALFDHRANPIGVIPWGGIGVLYWAWAWFDRKRFQ